jgi:phosphatidylglycerol:prolipoprotein diacylglycerol transferase
MADPIYAYIMAASICAGILVARYTQVTLPISTREKLGIGIGAFCGAMIGAKLPFVLADWDGLVSGWAWFSNGKTILCGLVGGYFGVELAKWLLGVRIKTGDSFAVPVAVAVGIGRLGCFHAGCCYGTPTDLPWGVVFPNVDGLARHPTQLYESAFHLSMASVLFALQRRGLFRGQLIKLYILSYLVYRFLTEMIRPEARLAVGLTGYQWASLVLIALFAWLWMKDAAAQRQAAIVAN